MNKLFETYLPNVKNPAGKAIWIAFALIIFGSLFMTAGYFSGKALYYFTH